ncbi:MTH1187 family thiamine-binding protein [Alteribacillus sp. HJP-4]|uniref:MTH1187 family thiamine-binding protein n=1 Tax=Alteribacillus sp. HJP-4 TaxID=2775394 RepID=UPI0035CD0B3F
MAIIDITIVPVGTGSTSMSGDVARIQDTLEQYSGKIKYQLTPMSTIVEGELPVLFEVIQSLHNIPFNEGAERVTTNIRIDDRRDGSQERMEGKIESVREKQNK